MSATVKAWELPLLKPLALVKPVVTRWSYLYFCFCRLVRLEEALIQYQVGEVPEADDTRDISGGDELLLEHLPGKVEYGLQLTRSTFQVLRLMCEAMEKIKTVCMLVE